MTIPNILKIMVIAQIHQDGISELLKQGYSEAQILMFIRQNIKHCFNTDRITVPITDIDVYVVDSNGEALTGVIV